MTTFSLSSYFQEQAIQKGYTISAVQEQTIKQLTDLGQILCSTKKLKRPPCYYLFGPVGRGKSWILNTFFEAMPIQEKQRFHFHSFFKQLHQKIFQYSQSNNPTKQAIDELLKDTKLICFDEFHVHDIGDAMLITQLFKILFERHIAIITTSNYPPEKLLDDPMYHERFIPTITLLKQYMHIINIDNKIDFRTLPQKNKQGFSAGYYIHPATAEQRQQLNIPTHSNTEQTITISNRQLHPLTYTENSITFNFEELCEQDTSSNDYLILIEQFNTLILDNVPALNTTSLGVQQRFINLIDILYDQNKCLYLLTHYSLDELLDCTAIGDMIRTRSRLSQLQKC